MSLCSAASLRAGEPLEGTAADGVRTWILLEYARPWEPKPLEPSELPASVKTHMEGWLSRGDVRHQFIRRPGSDGKRPTLLVAHARAENPWVLRFELDDYEDILELDLAQILNEERHDNAQRVMEPQHFVCAHGRRDRCCGLKGSALFRRLHAVVGTDVWQTSHLGGHRFAACVLSLPYGVYYGRLGDEHAEALLDAHRKGEMLDLDHVRGRCAWGRPVQAAEIFLRRHLRDKVLGGWRHLDTQTVGDSDYAVHFDVRGESHRVNVLQEMLDAERPTSCDADPESIVRFIEAG